MYITVSVNYTYGTVLRKNVYTACRVLSSTALPDYILYYYTSVAYG